jgi:hypothetical protein
MISISSQSITQHQAILDNVEMNGITSSLLGSELSKGGSHGVSLSMYLL